MGEEPRDGAGLPGGDARDQAAERLAEPGRSTELDRLVGLAAQLVAAPSAQLSLLRDVQVVAAGAGGACDAVGRSSPLSDSLCSVTAAGEAPLVVTDAAADPRVAALPPVTSGAVGSYLGVPVRSRDGHVVGALCAFGPAPRTWSETDVTVLTGLAAAAGSELERAALSVDRDADRLRWQLSIAVGGVGGFDLDVRTGRLTWDDRMLEIFGYGRHEFSRSIDDFARRLHPDDRERIDEGVQGALASCGVFDAEYRIVLPDGRTRWVRSRGTALPGPDGTAARLLGAAYDTTAGRVSDANLSRVLESMSAAFYSLDQDWRFSYVNAEAERLLGRSREELLGGEMWDLFPESVGSVFEREYRAAARTREPRVFEGYYPQPLDSWYEVRVWPAPDGLWVYALDISARRRAQEEAETAAARLRLLARVSEDLNSTLDVEAAMSRLGRHLVPALGDWCIITLVDEHGTLHDIGSWHDDVSLLPTLERYAGLRLRDLDAADSPVARAVASGRPFLVPPPAEATISATLGSTEARELLHRLAPETAAVLPLRARGRTSGLITLGRGAGRTPLEGQDLLTAVEVSERAALALDNARLYGEQQHIAARLQRSLLTEPVQPEGLEIVVRYQPSGEAARVGGDWYDAFSLPDGRTVLVIGDVEGHDIDAAATMGQVRSLLRGIAHATGASPAATLTHLDAAMRGLAVSTTATAVMACLERDAAGAHAGTTRLRWANAGHPPPLLLAPDGSTTLLEGADNDLLLGVDPGWHRVDEETGLHTGSTLLMYTDGLVERRGQPMERGMTLLRETVEGLAGAELHALVDGVLARMVPGAPDDDVAVVAVRLGPV